MKIEELGIGDWVRHTFYEENVRIVRIYGDSERVLTERGKLSISCHLNHFEPIPLTPEILEKNGETNKDYLAWLIAKRVVVEKEPTGEYSVHIYDAAIDKVLVTARAQHVHQLQHALRLAGIDKEIEV